MQIAFESFDGAAWTGGGVYLSNVLAALQAVRTPEQRFMLLVSDVQSSKLVAHLGADDTVCLPSRVAKGGVLYRALRKLHRRRSFVPLVASPVGKFLREQRIDALFTTTLIGSRFNVALVGWIPDFQHVHLPEMFSAAEREYRDYAFRELAAHADVVVLSSEDVKRDFETFAPDHAAKARVVSFVAQVPAEVYGRDPAWVCDHYGLPTKFFYVPNQFWKHKNNEVVLRAIEMARSREPSLAVVFTGNTNDQRNPSYFAELLARVSAAGIRANVVLLGLVPRSHVFALMRQSLAMLQPSRFEGWSTSVEEAKSLGKQVFLSDLAVHREQSPPSSRYFDPMVPEALAELLIEGWHGLSPGPDLAMEEESRKSLPIRTQEFGRRFLAVTTEAIQKRG